MHLIGHYLVIIFAILPSQALVVRVRAALVKTFRHQYPIQIAFKRWKLNEVHVQAKSRTDIYPPFYPAFSYITECTS